MNWLRGLLLSGVNLAAAVPLIVMLEVRVEAFHNEHAEGADHAPPTWIASDPVLKTAPSADEGETVTFDPCSMWAHYPTEELIARFANLPAITLAGWRQACPPRWTLAGMLKVGYPWTRAPYSLMTCREVDGGFALLVAVQWFLVGAFPLVRPKLWWFEPGAFITVCTVIAFGIVFVRPIAELARLPALLAAFVWFWWFGLLIWKTARSVWKLAARRRVATP